MTFKLDRDLVVVDVESNGLYGQPFCVGAVLMDRGGRVLDEFIGRCGIDQVEDEWVLNNVLPSLDVDENYKNLEDLEEAFIKWFAHPPVRKNEGPPPHVIVDVGFPVDTAFLYRLGLRTDRWGDLWRSIAPYPLYDLSSILAGMGLDTNLYRSKFANPLIGTASGKKHNPLWDAELTGLCVIRAMRLATKRISHG